MLPLRWGGPIGRMFDTTRLKSYNRSRGCPQRQTYHSEGLWDFVSHPAPPGDFVLVGFGHNDGSPRRVRRRNPCCHQRDGTPDTIHTYVWNMRKSFEIPRLPERFHIVFAESWGSSGKGKLPGDRTYAKAPELAESEQGALWT
jgi:hypothetical protein